MISTRFKLLNFYSFTARHISASSQLQCDKFRNIDKFIPKNAYKGFDNGMLQKESGVRYDYKPFKLVLKKGKRYLWCLCGHSKSQPLCDGTHKIDALEIKLRPIIFEVDETKEYWLCNCKRTKHRPFCDGTHLPFYEHELRRSIIKRRRRSAAAEGDKDIEVIEGEDEIKENQ